MIKFEKKAMERFNKIPNDVKSKILSNVYCAKCKDTVKIIDFEATMDEDDLILKGKCGKCFGTVARLIEG
ncbi:MAG: hypothetical protein COA44_13990 [Arcobacter sp.]|nr:MAG: hypothetical protein COA44_13990 [Arcobacter sp.]